MGRKGMLVSCIRGDLCLDSCIFSLSFFFSWLLLGRFPNPSCWYLTSWNETQQSTMFVVRLGPARTNPADSDPISTVFELY